VVSLSFLSNTQIFVLACARKTSFHASKRQRSHPSAESQSPPDLTQQSGIYRGEQRLSTLEPFDLRQAHSEENAYEAHGLPSNRKPQRLQASGRLLTARRVSVCHEPLAPRPSTTPPNQLSSRHGISRRGAPRLRPHAVQTAPLGRAALTAFPQRGTPRPRPTPFNSSARRVTLTAWGPQLALRRSTASLCRPILTAFPRRGAPRLRSHAVQRLRYVAPFSRRFRGVAPHDFVPTPFNRLRYVASLSRRSRHVARHDLAATPFNATSHGRSHGVAPHDFAPTSFDSRRWLTMSARKPSAPVRATRRKRPRGRRHRL